MGVLSAPFALNDTPIENQRPLKVRVIGAGYSGIYLGTRIPQRLRNVDLAIYEKNEAVGGTWFENRYPGCACDIPSHSYQYSFAPNPRWSALYAPAPEICAYLTDVAEKFGAARFIKCLHKVTHCEWDDSRKKWKITVEKVDTGETFDEESDVVIAARGSLNSPAWPKIDGLDTFSGEVMHSAKWNQEYDFTNKKIGVIGGGSSSIQIVPILQKLPGTTLSCFVRSKSWISNPFGDEAMKQLGLDPKITKFSTQQQEEFAADPEAYLKFRKVIETDGNTIHGISFMNNDLQKRAFEGFKAEMSRRLSKKPEIIDKLTPSFAVGCRRLTPGPGYLEALVEDNVSFISTKISHMSPKGIHLTDGTHIALDALVCATGFDTGGLPPFAVIGRNGRKLADHFSPYPQTYLTIATNGFPNYFMMLGPNAAIGTGSLTTILESQGDYIVKCIRKLQRENYVSMEPQAARVKDFSDYVGAYFKDTVYMDECNSWYRSGGGKGDRITGLWPGSTLHAVEALRSPRWEDWGYEGQENRLAWLGNGWSVTQLGEGDPAFYLEPSIVDIPPLARPEEDERLKRRPFCY